MKTFWRIGLLVVILMAPSAVRAGDILYPEAFFKIEGNAFFDSRTGHKYMKADHQTYMEYDRKGQFLKRVPSSLPLLLSSGSVHPISADHYILYKKSVHGEARLIARKAVSPHPEGWKAYKLLLTHNPKTAMGGVTTP